MALSTSGRGTEHVQESAEGAKGGEAFQGALRSRGLRSHAVLSGGAGGQCGASHSSPTPPRLMGVVVPRAASCAGTYRGKARPGPEGRSRPS